MLQRNSAFLDCSRRICILLVLWITAAPHANGTPEKTLEWIITAQWTGDPAVTREELQTDVAYARGSIIGETPTASAWIASSTVLLKWIGFKEYIDLARTLEAAYERLAPSSLEADFQNKFDTISQQPDDWVGWINAGLMAQALHQPATASLCFGRARECPTCVDSPGLHALFGKALLETGDLAGARIEYASAVSMASETNNPSFLFRMRQLTADDYYDLGHLEEAVEKGYRCIDSDYPLEKAWGRAMEIVYLWSKDDPTGVQASTDALAAILPDATPQADSDWERRRFEQIRFLLTTADEALAGDAFSKLVLDVEATEFHYKTGDLVAAMNRLEPWVAAYPTSQYASLSPEEKEWSLWAKYNYALLLSAALRLAESETLLREVLDTVPEGENPQLVSLCWGVLAQTLSLEGKKEEALLAYDQSLQLDASEISHIPAGVEDLNDQPVIEGGKLPDGSRAAFVRERKHLLSELTMTGGGN